LITASIALLAALIVSCAPADSGGDATSPLSFTVQYDGDARSGPLDGRVILLIAPADTQSEPRFQLRSEPARSAQGFGIDVEGWQPGEPAVVDGATFGHPIEALADLPAGEYSVQAVLNVYETFELATGHTVSLPPDRGEGQQWNRKPGNLYSAPTTVRVDPSRAETRSTSGTSACEASCSRNSGAATCTSARTCWCLRASTTTPRPGTR
jgi:hypothetical protein